MIIRDSRPDRAAVPGPAIAGLSQGPTSRKPRQLTVFEECTYTDVIMSVVPLHIPAHSGDSAPALMENLSFSIGDKVVYPNHGWRNRADQQQDDRLTGRKILPPENQSQQPEK